MAEVCATLTALAAGYATDLAGRLDGKYYPGALLSSTAGRSALTPRGTHTTHESNRQNDVLGENEGIWTLAPDSKT